MTTVTTAPTPVTSPTPTVTPSVPVAAQPKPARKMFPLKPAVNFVSTGTVVETLVDIYPSSNVDPNIKEDDGNPLSGFINSSHISVEKVLTIVGQAQFQCGSDIIVRVEVLGEELSGWVTVYRVSEFKEWRWIIPPKRAQVIKDAFASMFKVVVAA